MSRAFVKEDSQEEPPRIPPRASLPEGTTNYVTPQGMKQLEGEKKVLESKKSNLDPKDDSEQRRELMLINGKLELLNERIKSARVINPEDQPAGEVRFGATVMLQLPGRDDAQAFQIVGVDQADFKKRKIAFTSPVARILIGKELGETAELKRHGDSSYFKVLDISYQ